MKKIILNKCYGGFGVSDKVYEEYAKEKGFKLFRYEMIDTNKYVFIQKDCGSFRTEYSKEYLGEECSTIPNHSYFYIDSEYREDKTLIEIVERLGEEANGDYSYLKVVEIPDDLDYVIENYDGIETLHQRVQEW